MSKPSSGAAPTQSFPLGAKVAGVGQGLHGEAVVAGVEVEQGSGGRRGNVVVDVGGAGDAGGGGAGGGWGDCGVGQGAVGDGLPPADRVLLVAVYYPTDLTTHRLAPLFGISTATVCRIIQPLGLRPSKTLHARARA